MTLKDSNNWHARKAHADIKASKGAGTNALNSVWSWLNSVADVTINLFSGSVTSALKTILATLTTLVDAYRELADLYGRIFTWVWTNIFKPLDGKIDNRYAALLALIAKRVRYLEGLILVVGLRIIAYVNRQISTETVARMKQVKYAMALASREDIALHQTLEREAASGYRLEHDKRVSTVVRILEFAVTRNPELRVVVGEAVTILLDILSVDDPLIRLAMSFIVRDMINKLGVDKLVGTLASDMINPILGDPKPNNIHDVVKDISTRLAALEDFAATFAVNGGSQVEQAGELMRDITKPLGAAGIAAFVATAIVDPTRWAAEISGTIGTLGNDTVSAAERLIKGA